MVAFSMRADARRVKIPSPPRISFAALFGRIS